MQTYNPNIHPNYVGQHNTVNVAATENAMSVAVFLENLYNYINAIGPVDIIGEIQQIDPKKNAIYITLKDENGQGSVSCLMWRNVFNALPFVPAVGMLVVVRATPNVYKQTGSLSLILNSMRMAGIGQILERLAKLKIDLKNEGVFDYHKRPIPDFIDTVGVITSADGEVVHDIQTTMQRRNPGVNILVYDAKVQGNDAPLSLIKALRLANEQKLCDVLIIGRGGGSFEHLLPFSDEALTREVALSEIPIISAVGHEPDVSLTDYAADLRAATPTAAAEIVTRITQKDLYDLTVRFIKRLDDCALGILSLYDQNLSLLLHRLKGSNPENFVSVQKGRIETFQSRMDSSLNSMTAAIEQRLSSLRQSLSSFEPKSLLHSSMSKLNQTVARLNQAIDDKRTALSDRLDVNAAMLNLNNLAQSYIDRGSSELNSLVLRAQSASPEKEFNALSADFMQYLARLKSADPLYLLSNGYSVTYAQDNKVVDISKVRKGDVIKTVVKGGSLTSVVNEINVDNDG